MHVQILKLTSGVLAPGIKISTSIQILINQNLNLIVLLDIQGEGEVGFIENPPVDGCGGQ
jgi:hypothetical protein